MAVAVNSRFATATLALLGLGVAAAAIADSIGKATHRQPQPNMRRAAVGPHELGLLHRDALARTLKRLRASGTLYLVDAGCELHALRLPMLETAPAPATRDCRALVSPATAPPGWSLWPRSTPLVASCTDGRLVVAAPSPPALPMIGGCAPAWRPDGSITYIRHGAVVQFPRTGRAEVVRSAEQLTRALERRVRSRSGWQVGGVAWAGSSRFAVIASAGARALLVLFAGRRIVATSDVPVDAAELRSSPRGTYVVVRTSRDLRVYDTRRTLQRVRRFGAPTAITWSTDEKWVAVSRGAGISLQRGRAQIVLPVAALDLAWTRTLR